MPIAPALPTPPASREPITTFRGQHAFLSSFMVVPSGVRYGDLEGRTVEHVFQALKTLDPIERVTVLAASTPGGARSRGRMVTLRPDWDAIKLGVMAVLVSSKFQDPTMRDLLLATGDALLIEGNHWCDTFWGVCLCDVDTSNTRAHRNSDTPGGTGQNWLGTTLMIQRSLLHVRRE